MLPSVTTAWLSAHLYYNEPWETFLIKSVKPLIDGIINSGLAERFFFIRYNEKGPHIRLRINADEDKLKQFILPNLREHFESYFDSKPSSRDNTAISLSIQKAEGWLDNNKLYFIDYEQELSRFGGINGISIVEDQFFLSSKTVLSYIADYNGSWNYDLALGTAMSLHLGFVKACGFDAPTSANFYSSYCNAWLSKATNILNIDSKKLLHSFEKSFQEQKDFLGPYLKDLEECIDSDIYGLDDKLLIHWVQENTSIIYRLKNELPMLVKRSEDYTYNFDMPLPPNDELLWSIYFDFVHLTNNRLGIKNQDEAFIGYMLKRYFEIYA